MSFSIPRSVPILMSRGWSATVVLHWPSGETNCLWDPFCRTSTQPSRSRIRITSLLVTVCS